MAFRPRLKGYKFTPERWAQWLARLNEQETDGDVRRRQGITSMRAALAVTESRLTYGMAEGQTAQGAGTSTTTAGRLTDRARRAPGAASGRH